MTYTFFDAQLDLAEITGGVIDGVVTEVNSTHLADSGFWNLSNTPDDTYNQGTIFNISAGGSNSWSAVVTDFAQSGGVFSFAAVTSTYAVGDSFAVSTLEFPQVVLKRSINRAYGEMYMREQTNNTLFTTVANQLAYALPSTAGVYNVVKFEVATNSTTPYDYRTITGWKEIGTNIQLAEGTEFRSNGYVIRLTYVVRSSTMTLDSATIPDMIPRERLKWEAAVHAFRWKAEQTGGDEWYIARLGEAEGKARLARQRFPIERTAKVPALPNWFGDGGRSQDVFGDTVRLS